MPVWGVEKHMAAQYYLPPAGNIRVNQIGF
jgi:hypothetical protein